MAYVGQADENRLGLVSFFLNVLTGVAPIEIGDALLWKSDRMNILKEPSELSVSFETLSGIIENISQSLIEDELNNGQKSLHRNSAMKID